MCTRLRRLEFFGALFVSLAGAVACGDEAGRIQQEPEPEPEPIARPDAGVAPSPDGGVPSPDAGAGASPCPCTFLEEFTEPARIDGAGTTATVDTAAPGALRAGPGFELGGSGAGGEGALSLTADGTITAGTHEYSSLDIAGAAVRIAGDATLRVAGPVNLSRGASLVVTGKLTLVASGNVVVDCARVVTTGDLVVHQPSGDFTVRCATAGLRAQVLTDYRTAGDSGSIAVWTRGAIRLGGAVDLYTGSIEAAAARSGAIDLRAYGDVALGPGEGLVITGGGAGRNGDLGVSSEGRVVVDGLRVAGGDSTSAAAAGGSVNVRARGPVALSGGGNLLSSPGGSVEVLTESSLTLENSSFILTPEGGRPASEVSIHLRARTLRVGSTAVPGDRSAVIARAAATRSASLRVEVLEDIELLEAATVGTTPIDCLPAGDVTLASERNVILGAGALLKAGDSRAGAGCSAGPGGSLSVSAAGELQNAGGVASGGSGAPNGMTDMGGGRGVRVGVLAAELVPLVRVTSLALPLEGTSSAPALIGATWGPASPAQYSGLYLSLGVGQEFALVRYAPSLGENWRYRVVLEPRMFDPVTLDSFTIRY